MMGAFIQARSVSDGMMGAFLQARSVSDGMMGAFIQARSGYGSHASERTQVALQCVEPLGEGRFLGGELRLAARGCRCE